VSGKSGRGRGKNAPRAEGIGDAIAMPFANINFSELIKAAISLSRSLFRISLSLFLSLSQIHENEMGMTRTTMSTTSEHR